MKYTHLTMEERMEIGNCLRNYYSIRQIAEVTARSISTISREIKRNSSSGRSSYSPLRAERLSKERRSFKLQKIAKYPWLKLEIDRQLAEGLSPEMISGRMKRMKSDRTISTESIYQYVYSDEGRYKNLPKLLCRHRPYRGCWKLSRRKRIEENQKTHISQRPPIAANLQEIGHFEADLLFAKGSQSIAIAVTIEKKSRLARLKKVPSKHSDYVISKVSESLKSYNLKAILSLTTDNGREFAQFKRLEYEHSTTVYFCNPHSPWEKPQVESLNNILRRFIPRSKPLKDISDQALHDIELKLNSLPRKCLGFATPIEAFGEAYA